MSDDEKSELWTKLEDYGFDEEILPTLEEELGDYEGFLNCTFGRMNEIFDFDKMKDDLFKNDEEDVEEDGEYDEETFGIYKELFTDFMNEVEWDGQRKEFYEWMGEIGVIDELAKELVRKFQNLENFKTKSYDEIKEFIDKNEIGMSDIKRTASLDIIKDEYIEWQTKYKRNRWIEKLRLEMDLEKQIALIEKYIRLNQKEKVEQWESQIDYIQGGVKFKMRSYQIELTPVLKDKIGILQKVIQQTKDDMIQMKRDEWDINNSPLKPTNPLIGQIYSVDFDKNLLTKKKNLADLADCFEYLSRPFKERIDAYMGFDKKTYCRNYVFRNQEILNQFKESVAENSFIWEKFYVQRNDGLKIEGSFDWLKEWELVDQYKREQKEHRLIHASCFKHIEEEMSLDVKSVSLKNELVEEFVKLDQIKDDEEFEKQLMQIENEYGAVLNSGNYYMGGIFMITGQFHKPVPKEEYFPMEQLILGKIKTERKAELFEPGDCVVPEDKIDEHMKYAVYKFSKDKKKEEQYKQKLYDYNNIKIENHSLGRDVNFKTFRSFTNNLTGSNQSWRVAEMDLHLMYLGDLLMQPKTTAKFRERGMSTLDVFELKKRVWKSFRKRTQNKIQSRVRESLDSFQGEVKTEKEGKEEIITEKEDMIRKVMHIYTSVFKNKFNDQIINNKTFDEIKINFDEYEVEDETENKIYEKIEIGKNLIIKFSLFIEFINSAKTLEDIENEKEHQDLYDKLVGYKKTGLEKEIWYEIQRKKDIIKKQMDGFMIKLRHYLIDRDIGIEPGDTVIRRNYRLEKRDEQHMKTIELVTFFLRAWNCIAGNVDSHDFKNEKITHRFHFFTLKRDTNQKEIEMHNHRKYEWSIQRELRPILWKPKPGETTNEVQQKYETIWKKYQQTKGTEDELNLREKFNDMFIRLSQQNIFEEDLSHELTHRLCTYLVLGTRIERILLISKVEDTKIREFVDFYSEHREFVSTKLTPRTFDFEHKLRQIFERLKMNDEQKRNFSLYLYSKMIHMLSDEFLEDFVYPKNQKEIEILMNTPELRKLLISSLEKCKILKKNRKESKLDLKLRNEKKETGPGEYDPVRERAMFICDGKDKFTYEEAMELKIRKRDKYIKQGRNMYKQIFDQMMIRHQLKLFEMNPGIPIKSTAETALAIYYLADANLKRIFVNNFYQSNTPIPLLFPNSRAFLAPLNALSFLYKDPNGNNIKLNPYFHPSAKWCFFQTKEMLQSIERLANVLFFKGSMYFPKLDKKPGNMENGTTYACAISNKNESDYSKIAQLNILLMNNYYFQRISENQRFLLTISKVIIIMRKENEDESKILEVYNFIKNHNDNPENKQKKLLIEIVEYKADESRECISTHHPENWYMTLEAHDRKDVEVKYIRAFIRDHQYSRDFGLNPSFPSENKMPERSHFSLREDVEMCKKMGLKIRFDMEEEPMKQIWENIIDLVEPMDTGETGILKLQDGLYKEYHQNEEHMLDVKITKNKKEKNKMFRDQMKKARIKQLEYISRLGEDSPVFKFMNHLIALDKSDQVTYLFYLETYLEYKNVMHIFEVDQEQHLQSVNLFREMNQIYEVLKDFISYFRNDDSEELSLLKDEIQVLPKIVAELFWNWYPLELINGDLTVVPVDWLKAVLEEIKKTEPIKNARMTVLTVMGAQNGGKSTFLNSMFNMTFRVFNGRTTRGAKAVMIKINRESFPVYWQKVVEHKRMFNFTNQHKYKDRNYDEDIKDIPDYLMILDTEGLGSIDKIAENLKKDNTEKEVYIRDNRMILMNSGLANFCIVNSMKEINTRILDILSMLMYSYARLREFNICPPMSMVFQDREYNDYQYRNLWRTSLDNLRLIYRNLKIDNPDIDLPNFEQLLKFDKGYERDIKMLAGFGREDQYTDRYVDAIEGYKDLIFSRTFIFQDENIQDIESFKNRMIHLYNIITYDTANFDAENFSKLNREKVHNIFKFKIVNKIGIMFDERLKDLGIQDWEQLENKKSRIIKAIGPHHKQYSSLHDHITEARNLRFIGEYETETNEKFRILSEEAFVSFQKEVKMRSLAKDALQLNFDTIFGKEKIRIINFSNKNVHNYQEMNEEFLNQYNKAKTNIETIRTDSEERLRIATNVKEHVEKVYEKFEVHEKMGSDLNLLREKFNNSEEEKDFLQMISKEIKKYNFANYPIILKFDQNRIRTHYKYVCKVQKNLNLKRIFTIEKNKEIKLNSKYFFDLVKELNEVFLGKEDKTIVHSNWDVNGPTEICFNQKNKNVACHFMYKCLSFLYLSHVFYSTSKTISEAFIEKNRTEFKKFGRLKTDIQINYIRGCELSHDQKKSFSIYALLKEQMKYDIEKNMNDEFERSVNTRLLKFTDRIYLINQLKIDLLKNHFESENAESEEKKKEFVKDLILFGSDFSELARAKIERIVEDRSNLKHYQEDIQERILNFKKDVIKKVETDQYWAFVEKTYDESLIENIKNMKEDDPEEIKKEIINLLENEDWQSEIEEEISIQNKDFLLNKYTENIKLCMSPCDGCGAPCTLVKKHKESAHLNHNHLPLILRGRKRKFIT